MRGVSRTYDEGQPVHALRDTTLAVEPGDYLSVTGPSGSGKSTLLNILGLLDTPDTGSYRVWDVETVGGGEALSGSIRAQLFGFVFQAFHLLPSRSAIENVEVGMLYGPHRPRKRREIATETLRRVGLGHRLAAAPGQLSGGEKQRVAIARAIAADPRVLFADEPTGNLDSASTASVMELLQELNTQGLTLVVVTHDSEVAARARRRVEVRDGVVTEL